MSDRRQLGLVADYVDLIRCLRARREELDISYLDLDYACGFSSGTTAKYLAEPPDNVMLWGKQRNNWRALGPKTLGTVLFALGLALNVVEDAKALRMAGPMRPRQRRKRVKVQVSGSIPWLFNASNARGMGSKGAKVANGQRSLTLKRKWGRKGAQIRWQKRHGHTKSSAASESTSSQA